MAIINYDQNPNEFSADTTAMLLAVSFSVGSEYKELFPIIRNALLAIDKEICLTPLDKRKDKCKIIKDGLKKQWGYYLKTGDLPNSPLLKDIPKYSYSKEYCANIMASIVRWPEFYIYTESYMNIKTQNLSENLDMINSITYFDKSGKKICPYDPDIGIVEDISVESVWQTMEQQYNSCCKFLVENGDKLLITVEDIKQSFYKLKNQKVIIPGSFEEGLLKDIKYVNSKINNISEQMRRIAEGDIKSIELTLSESVSVIKSEKILAILKSIGWKGNNIPQVLANIFAMNYPTCSLKKYDGQIELNMNGEFFDPALGLGPAYKLRVVFNTHNQANNFLEPLARLIKESHNLNDLCEDYLNQCGVLNSDMNMITDLIDLDATGYSDYLSRTIYLLVMDLYRIPKDIQYKVMRIFAFPIKIGDKFHYPVFGTEQGCKLVVFLMNTANRLLGYLARDIYTRYTGKTLDGQRANTGDDVEDHIYTGTFDKLYLDIQISVFTLFNCPTNSQKCGWLSRDGVVSYCSRYYYLQEGGRGIVSCGGIPPKSLGKQILSFLQFAQIFKVLNNNKINHRPAIEVWDIIKPILTPDMQMACKIFKNIHGEHSNFSDKERLARNVDVELGGLMEGQFTKDLETYLKSLKYRFSMILSHYMFDAVGVFLIANQIVKEETELWKCLATVHRTSLQDVMHIMNILTTDDNIYDKEELDWCRKNINRLERAIIKGTSISNSSSTYHRKTQKKDLDLFLDEDMPIDIDYKTDWFKNADNPAMSLARFIDCFADKTISDVDKIRNYFYGEMLLKKYSVESYSGTAFYNDYDKLRVWDVKNSKYVRIYESKDDYYNTIYGRVSNIWETQDQASPEVKDFIVVYKAQRDSNTARTIYGVYDRILNRKTKRQSLTVLESFLKQRYDISYAEARKAAKKIYDELQAYRIY